MTTSEAALQPPTLSVITVTWNHKEDVGPFLKAMEAARESSAYALEMIVVDNDSGDGTPDIIQQQFPWVRLIQSGRNAGFAVGCNIGMEAAQGDFLMLFNPDARADGGAFAALLEYLRTHPRVGAVGPRLEHEDGLPQISAYTRLGPGSYIANQSMLYPVFERLWKLLYRVGFQPRRARSCGWLQGACIVIPRATYLKVGGFEPSYFMYGEDADLCERIHRAGFDVVHLPTVAVRHRQKGSTRKAPEYTFRRLYRSLIHYANRHMTGFRKWLFFSVMDLDMTLRVPLYWIKALLNWERREAIWERIGSVRRLLAMIAARNPDLFDDPPPGRPRP